MDLNKIILLAIIFVNLICIFLFFYEKSFLKRLKEEKKKIDLEINDLKNKKEEIVHDYYNESASKFLEDYKKELETYNKIVDEIEDFDIGLKRNFDFKFENSTIYRQKIADLDKEEKDLIKNGNALNIYDGYEKGIDKIILRAFNKEVEKIIDTVTVNNLKTKSNQIQQVFDSINKNSAYVNLTYEFLSLKLEKLELAHEYAMKLDVENEILKEEREREKENKIAEKEIQEKKDKINKEIRHYNNAINEIEEQLTVASKEDKANLEKQLLELNYTLKQLEDENIDLDYKLNNVSAGYVYIISNVGSFGKDVYKIGVTRRENWHERIAELSSASVPFKFDENIIVFSKNAFELETNLHQYFDDRRVNLVNYRKEFFKVTLDEVKEALKKFDVYEFDSLNYETSDEYNQTLNILKNC